MGRPKKEMEGYPESVRKRAAYLKAQGWWSQDVEERTEIPKKVIEENWHEWADEFHIPVPPKKFGPPVDKSSGPVLSYRIDIETGEHLTEPQIEEVPTKRRRKRRI